jgi:hypothetical protein
VSRRKKNTPAARPSATRWILETWPSRTMVGDSCLKGLYSVSARGKKSRRVRVVATMDFDAPFKVPIRPTTRTGSAEVARLLSLAIKELSPADASVYFRKPGGRPTKRTIYEQAKKLREGPRSPGERRPSYPEVARILTPQAFKASPRKAGEAIRRGIERL